MKNICVKWSDDMGASMIEYGLIAFLIASVIIVALTSMGNNVDGTFCHVASSLSNTGGCNPGVNALNAAISNMEADLKSNEDAYKAAWQAKQDIINQADAAKAANDWATYNTLVNGGPTASWDDGLDSAYKDANNALIAAMNNMLTSNEDDDTSINHDLNSILSPSGPDYNNMVSQNGADTMSDAASQVIASGTFTDPATGQTTPLSSMYQQSLQQSSGWGVTADGAATATSQFMAQYPQNNQP